MYIFSLPLAKGTTFVAVRGALPPLLLLEIACQRNHIHVVGSDAWTTAAGGGARRVDSRRLPFVPGPPGALP